MGHLEGPGAPRAAGGNGSARLLEEAGAAASCPPPRSPRHRGHDQRRHERLRLAANEGATRPGVSEVNVGGGRGRGVGGRLELQLKALLLAVA